MSGVLVAAVVVIAVVAALSRRDGLAEAALHEHGRTHLDSPADSAVENEDTP